MARYAVHHDWVDLVAARFGRPTGNVYGKASDGTAARRGIGVWADGGRFVYADGTRPRQALLDAWAAETATLGWATWLEKRVDSSSTWGDLWEVLETEDTVEQVLAALTRTFSEDHAPVPGPQRPDDGGIEQPDPQRDPDEGVPVAAREPVPERVPTPAARFVTAQSWSIASQLVRRHPELVVHEMHPAGGSYDVLALGEPGGEFRLSINRVGSIQILPVGDARWSWADVLAAESPHRLVQRLETAMGLRVPSATPAATGRSLSYRFIASVLRWTVDGRSRWDARNDFIDSSAEWWPGDPETNGYLERFPQAEEDSRAVPRLGLHHEPHSHYWALLRDGTPRALVSIEGRVFLPGRSFDLLREYVRHDRRLEPVVARVLVEIG